MTGGYRACLIDYQGIISVDKGSVMIRYKQINLSDILPEW